MRKTVVWLALLAACGGGGGDGGGGGPPPPPYATTTGTGLAIASAFAGAATLPPRVLVAVSELEMNADLNGDGDIFDQVVHEVNTATGTVTNLGLPIVGRVLASDVHFAFPVGEAAQAGTDLNGDGDTLDSVWFVYDPARPRTAGLNPQNTGLAAPATGAPGAGTRGGFVLLQAESAANLDLNADGDMNDMIPRAFHGPPFAVSGLVVPAHATGTPLVSRNGRILVAASEVAERRFLNGDGDQTDVVLGAVDFNPGLPLYVRVGAGAPRSVANHPYALTDGAAVYFIDEASEGPADLNNDADTNDAIVAVFDLATGGGEILPMTPLLPSFTVAGAPSLGLAVGPNRLIVGVSEAAQGNRDINNDFDTTDVMLAWVDTTAPGALHLFPTIVLGPVPPVIDGPRGLVAISERGSTFSGVDLNGDADVNDNVAHVLDTSAAPGSLQNLSTAVAGFAAQRDDALLAVSEAADKGIDRNGNGTATDIVQLYCDLRAHPATMRNLAVVTSGQTYFRLSDQELRLGAFLQEGQSPAFGDRNGDGDTSDLVLELIALDPSGTPPPILAPTPFFAGTHSFGSAPPLRVGNNVFAFATSEVMAGSDLNGDGDLNDTVLQYVTIN